MMRYLQRGEELTDCASQRGVSNLVYFSLFASKLTKRFSVTNTPIAIARERYNIEV